MKKLSTTLLLSALLVSPLAFAGGNADKGVYAGVTVGKGKPNFTSNNGLSKSSDTTYGALLGYKLNKNFAVEGEYTTIGKEVDNSVPAKSIKGDALGLSAVGIAPLNDKFSVYGKLGYARTKTSTSGFNGGASRSAPTYGIGAQYNVSPMFGVRLGFDRFGAAINNGGVKTNANANVTSLAAVFNF